MDEGVADGVAPVDGIYLQAKEGDYVAKAAGASILGSHEMIIPTRGDYHEGNNSDIGNASQLPHSSANCSDDAGVMVEELTLRNYNGENLAIVGTSNNRDGLQTRMNQWQHLYQMAGGFGSDKDCGQVTSNAWQDNGNTVFPELLSENPHDGVKNGEMEHPQNTENEALTKNMSITSAGIRTKILSRSGFSEYFVKNTLKGKGIVCKGPAHKGFGAQFRSQSNLNAAGAATVSDAPLSSSSKTHVSSSNVIAGPRMGLCPNAYHDGIKLREWLKDGRRKSNKVERLYIFKQIVDLVDQSHSQGLALQDLRPSCFNLLSSNQIVYLGSFVREESVETQRFRDNAFSENNRNDKRPLEQLMHPIVNQLVKKQKFGENQKFIGQGLQFASRSGFKSVLGNCVAGSRDSLDELDRKNDPNSKFTNHSDSSNYYAAIASQQLSSCASDPLEEAWYTSPEERCVKGCSFSSNIYVLGVLLFELLGCFDTESARAAAMSDLHHRILPPNFLSENPKEAGFCLWLLHPGPSSRPTAREVLRSDVISGIEESFGHELSSSIDEDDTESELLLHFLISMKGQKHKDSVKLVEEIKCLEADIEEVEKRRTGKSFDISFSSKEPFNAKGDQPLYNEHSSFEVNPEITQGTSNEYMFVKNISQLESAYFCMRSNIQISDNDTATRTNCDLLKERDVGCQTQLDEEKRKPIDPVGAFFSGLCKYARYSKFEVRGILRNGEFHNSANVVCSMSFDRDREYFAAAGISKRIKIFEFQALFNEAVDVHYPVVEMPNKSRLSCVCWNSYIRNYLASTDYDGTVKLWDAGTGQVVSQYIEHNKRAWSVDFSQVDPTKLASGSDDYSVKLWSINERNSLCTMKSIANACCVQFSGHSSHLVAFGSSDYKTYCYDLRNVSSPWCILAGHDKAVSFVKFLDSQTLVSASTDNSLKLWDLNKTSSSGLSTSACISTLKGHTNEKNFVGLSVADGYIACGSETNEVYAYYRSLPMPITSHKFGSIDPISGKETDDDNGQFVSSVCWRPNSDMLLAANSSGCIKVLQMV